MPENQKSESRELLVNILTKTFECDKDVSFEDLLAKIDSVTPTREQCLEEADQRLNRLLNTSANTSR